jgi:Trk K+ transport system NAD-binding subunit
MEIDRERLLELLDEIYGHYIVADKTVEAVLREVNYGNSF